MLLAAVDFSISRKNSPIRPETRCQFDWHYSSLSFACKMESVCCDWKFEAAAAESRRMVGSP